MTREKSFQHRQLEILDYRTSLNHEDKNKLQKLKLGYEGELLFDQFVSSYVDDYGLVHLKDVLFAVDGGSKEIQVDNIIIADDCCFIFEVKNFSFNLSINDVGNFFYEDGNECSMLNVQSERQKGSVRYLLDRTGYPFDVVKHYMVFVNPDQTVYGLKREHGVLTRNTLTRFLNENLKWNQSEYSILVDRVNDRRLKFSKYDLSYKVELDYLRRGVYCSGCYARYSKLSRRRFICDSCGGVINVVDAIRLLIQDVYYLNPEYRPDSEFLSKLSGGEISSSIIRRHRRDGKINF